jgi:hypothetical protein
MKKLHSLANRNKTVLGLSALVVLGITLVGSINRTEAAGVTVAPAYLEAKVEAGKTTSQSVTVTNSSDQEITIEPAIREVEEQAGRFVPRALASTQYTQNIQTNQASYVIAKGGSAEVTITFADSVSLSPGGHYVSLLLTQKAQSSAGVGLESAVSVLLYVVKESGATRSVEATDVSLPRVALFGVPKGVTASIQNTGNVAVVPRGALAFHAGGHIIASGVLNDAFAPLQPSKTARYNVQVTPVKSSYLPARVQVRISYRYDGAQEIKTLDRSFWYVPWYWFAVPPVGWLLVRVARRLPRKKRSNRAPTSAKRPKNTQTPKVIQDIVVNKDKA